MNILKGLYSSSIVTLVTINNDTIEDKLSLYFLIGVHMRHSILHSEESMLYHILYYFEEETYYWHVLDFQR